MKKVLYVLFFLLILLTGCNELDNLPDEYEFNVIYESNGGTLIDDETILEGEVLSLPENPVKEGYVFEGWYLDNDFIDEFADNDSVINDITLYAKWSVARYTLTFADVDGVELISYELDYGTSISNDLVPESPLLEGYNFVGWDNEIPETMPSEDVTLTAVFEVIWDYMIGFDTLGGTLIDSIIVEENQTLTLPEQPTREGYTFVGWFTDESYETEYNEDLPVTSNFMLYAKWNINSYTITFRDKDGLILNSYELVYGTEIANELIPSDLDLEDFRFVDWDQVVPETMPAENIELQATYVEIVRYLIEYNTNGGTIIEDVIVEQGYTLQLPDAPEKEGYEFLDWYIDEELTILYDNSSVVTDNLVLYAKWSILSFTLRFELEDGTEISTYEVEYNTVIGGLIPSDPSLDGLYFTGWNQSIPYRMPANDVTFIATFEPLITSCDVGYMLVGNRCEPHPPTYLYSAAEVEEDFDQLVAFFENNNPGIFVDPKVLRDTIAAQRALIRDGMTEMEILYLLQPVVAAYNDGHSFIFNSLETYEYNIENAKFLPFDVNVVEGELYITGSTFEYDVELGSRILTINGDTASEIFAKFILSFPTDGANESSLYYHLNDNFRGRYFRFYDNPETFTIEYIEYSTGIQKEVVVEGMLWDDIYADVVQEEYIPWEAEYTDTYAIMTLNTFYPTSTRTQDMFYNFFEEFFTEVDSRGIQNVILDLRDNGGGDPRIASDLFSYLAAYSQPYHSDRAYGSLPELKQNQPLSSPHFDGNVYTLIGGGSFSSTGHFVSLMKHQNIGLFIGEESEGSYVCTAMGMSIELNNTNIWVESSTEIFEVDVDIEAFTYGRGIMPDYEVSLTLDDYLNGTDSVLEYAINLITTPST